MSAISGREGAGIYAFSRSSIAMDSPSYDDVLLTHSMDSRTRWFDPPTPRRDPRPVTLRLDAEDVNEETWRQIKLIAWKADENTVEASLLRPLWWIKETGAKPGAMIHLAMQDFGLVGPTKVLAINPCPKLEGGKGNFVIGKFKHSTSMMLHIHFEGLDKPLEVTPNHPLYSLDRDEYVEAGKLRVGERLKTRKGVLAKVAKMNVVFGKQYVYNLEVHRAHRYFVSELGIVAHNSYELTGVQNTSGYVRSSAIDNEENLYGTQLNNYSSQGALGEITTVEGAGQTIPGGTAPDYRITWSDGTQGYADLYNPEEADFSTIAKTIRYKANTQTQGGVVVVGLPETASDEAIRTATEAARFAEGQAGFSGKGVIIMVGRAILQNISKS